LKRFWVGPGWGKEWHIWSRLPLARKPPPYFVCDDKLVDFCRGPAEMANAVRQKRLCRLSPELGWHITELIERLQFPEKFGSRRELISTFEPIDPCVANE
jgi:hypothetical protein